MKFLLRLNIILFFCAILGACGGGSSAACSVAVGALTCAGSGTSSNKSSDTSTLSSGYNILHTMDPAKGEGTSPQASVVEVNGKFYGTTQQGGSLGFGTVYSMDTSGNVSTIYNFTNASDGSIPFAGLTLGKDGNLYGLTSNGGLTSTGGAGYGTVFQFNITNNQISTVYTFTGGSDGAHPLGALILGSDGNLYGTTQYGGSSNAGAGSGTAGNGTIFKLIFLGTNISGIQTVYTFTSYNAGSTVNTDGANPQSGLVQDSSGVLYGTTSSGGISGFGTVYSVNPNKLSFTNLHSFAGGSSDGSIPVGTLLIVSNNTLYGTTSKGGTNNCKCGTVFSVQTTSSASYQVLYSFSYPTAVGGVSDGSTPYGNLVSINGILYGTTNLGGSNNLGTIYSITTSGSELVVHSFGTISNDGSQPYAGLLIGNDGYYYGTTEKMGNNSTGSVYKFYP